MASEVADQRKVVFSGHAGHRPVVVNPRDRLHAPAVAVPQAHAVNALGAADVRRAVAADRNRFVGRQPAGHARHPEHFVAGLVQGVCDHLVDLGQLQGAGVGIGMNTGDQLELRFAEIGRDVRVGQRRAQRGRVGCERQRPVWSNPQALLFDAAAHRREPLRRDRLQSLFQTAHARFPHLTCRMQGNRWQPTLHSGHSRVRWQVRRAGSRPRPGESPGRCSSRTARAGRSVHAAAARPPAARVPARPQ